MWFKVRGSRLSVYWGISVQRVNWALVNSGEAQRRLKVGKNNGKNKAGSAFVSGEEVTEKTHQP